jgi:hypothetical protein
MCCRDSCFSRTHAFPNFKEFLASLAKINLDLFSIKSDLSCTKLLLACHADHLDLSCLVLQSFLSIVSAYPMYANSTYFKIRNRIYFL